MYGIIYTVISFLKIKDVCFLKYMAIHPLVTHLAVLKVIGSWHVEAGTHDYIMEHPFSGRDGDGYGHMGLHSLQSIGQETIHCLSLIPLLKGALPK